jgi:hypothetical protein
MRNYDELAEKLTKEWGSNEVAVFDELVRYWAEDRGLFDPPRPIPQALKTQEELDELFKAIKDNDRDEIVDAIGDIVVTLVIQARIHGYTLMECAWHAWDQIKDRKGKTVDGMFVKEAS